jgi:pyruvate kinase
MKKENLRKTKIVCTIGPASESEEMLTKLANAGMNVARINFSHGGYEENATKIETIKKVRKTLNKAIPMCLDTKGPEIRTGKLESGDEKVKIEEGQKFTFLYEDVIGNNTKTSISYKGLAEDVKPGASILVDDGALEFRVDEVVGKDVVCTAMNTAMLGSRKTVNVRGLKLNLPALSEKDVNDLTAGAKAGFDYIFASFVRRADDLHQMRKLLDENGGKDIKIISKIESQEGIDNFEEILELSDGIMVARGDMSVEVPFEKVPIVQKRFIKRCNEVGKPVITATQMLESMMVNPRPSRADVSDIANATYDRSTAVMLSGESAMGKHPDLCVATMDKITRSVEGDLNYWKRFSNSTPSFEGSNMKQHVAYIATETAKNLNADAIVAYTNSGDKARFLAGMGPACPIFAVTDNEKTFYQLGLVWNVTPILIQGKSSVDEIIEAGIEELKKQEILEKGDLIVISGGAKILNNNSENQIIDGVLKI